MTQRDHALPSNDGAALAAPPRRLRVVLVTGMSGAGKSNALKALEDIGYEAVDNLPISLLTSLITGAKGAGRPLAIGVDVRTRDFGVGTFVHELDALVAMPALDVRVLFLDCQDEVLRRRYTETRRRHPLAPDRPVTDGILREREMIGALRDRADVTLDTTDLTLGALQRELRGHFTLDEAPGLVVFVTSFSYRLGVPREADLVFDVRFLANPHYVDALRGFTGRDEAVGAFIERDPDFAGFFDALTRLLGPLLPRFRQEGKSYLTIAVGCTGGKHRSVYLAERLGAWLAAEGQSATVFHRDIDSGAAP